MERKVGSGRKGTVDEEEYLLRSVNKLVDRFNSTLGMDHMSFVILMLNIVFIKGKYVAFCHIYSNSLRSIGKRGWKCSAK
jgi:hypothetical protein